MKRSTKQSMISGVVGLLLAVIVISLVAEPSSYPITIGLFILLGSAALVSLVSIIAFGGSSSSAPAEMSLVDVADLIERFVTNRVGEWEWDDFTSCSHKDPKVERARREVVRIGDEFPARGKWCSEDGVSALLRLAETLRSNHN